MKLAAATITLVLVHANVVDVRDGSIARDMTVAIAGNRIIAVDRAAPPPGAESVDATGKYVIPGLWDMHVHWFDERYLPLFVANGVTGVRQMWGFELHRQWRARFVDGSLIAPRQVIASPIIDGPQVIWPGSVSVKDAAEARAAVAAAKADGFDFVKAYSMLPRDAFFALGEEAARLGVPFAGHVPFAVKASEAAAAGMKSLEHLTGVLLECSSREEEMRAELLAASDFAARMEVSRRRATELLETYDEGKAAALFSRFASLGTWACPTLTVNRSIAHLDQPSFTGDARLRYLPRSFREQWDPRNDFRFRDATAETFATARKTYAKQLQVVGAMNRAGVRFLTGTDVGNPYCFPGFSLHDELALLVEAGLSPLQALGAATAGAAEYLGSPDLGGVAAGKLADLVVLDANPLEEIRNTTKIAGVVVDGRYHSRAALDRLLARAAELSARRSLIEPLLATITAQNVEAAIVQFRALNANEPEGWDFDESQLNELGYRLLSMQRASDAIAILKLNAELFPSSANAHDSLAEAYLAAGEKENAITSYRRLLGLDPKNRSAAAKLKQLEQP